MNTSLLTILFIALFPVWQDWMQEAHPGYRLFYRTADQSTHVGYAGQVDTGIKAVQKFFNAPYAKSFDVYVHPGRTSLDQQLRRDWNMPDFKSECWMVAAGIGYRLDLLSPRTWSKEACEHEASDAVKTTQLITHELVHVFHGQRNLSQDFSDMEGIDWFVEGLATFASGQCDAKRMEEVRREIATRGNPASLDQFWMGNARYGLAGTMVMFIDKEYGRTKLIQLLRYNRKSDLLAALSVREDDLIRKWAQFVK